MLNISLNNTAGNPQQVSTSDQQTPTVDVPNSGAKKKVRSEGQREASRRNGRRSHGPENTERTRYNAMRHGLRAAGLTQWDNAEEHEENILAFRAIYPSSDPLDTLLIEQMALDMVRFRRICSLEAGTITALSKGADTSSDLTSDRCTPLIDPITMKDYAGPVLDRCQRYASATLNRLLRCRRELERIPRDEPSPDSTVADIGHGEVIVQPSSKLPS